MTMPQMQQAISNLRLLLVSVRAKDDELESLARQFRRQLSRAPRSAIQGGNPLETTLHVMGEIQRSGWMMWRSSVSILAKYGGR